MYHCIQHANPSPFFFEVSAHKVVFAKTGRRRAARSTYVSSLACFIQIVRCGHVRLSHLPVQTDCRTARRRTMWYVVIVSHYVFARCRTSFLKTLRSASLCFALSAVLRSLLRSAFFFFFPPLRWFGCLSRPDDGCLRERTRSAWSTAPPASAWT